MSITKLPNKKKEGVLEILDEAIDREYDEVIVIGFIDKQYYVTNSEISDALKVIGALTMAQYELLKIRDDYDSE